MHFRLGGILIASAIAVAPATAQQTAWKVTEEVDALTDAVTRLACVKTDGAELCGSFVEEHGFLLMLRSDEVQSASKGPALRIDRNSYIPSSPDSMRLSLRMHGWLAQEPPEGGVWDEDPDSVIGQLVRGRELLVRVFGVDNGSTDFKIPLTNACATIRDVLPPGGSLLCSDRLENSAS